MTGEDGDSGARRSLSPETLAAQALGRIDTETRSLVPALYPSTTYERDADGGYSSGRGYSRPHNPTYDEPEELLATLEGGADCLLFASGMAAATALFQALLPGDHVVASRAMYWALRTWLVDFAMAWGLDVEFVDTADLAALAGAMRPGKTRLVWLETPANPTWEVSDIAAAAEIARGVRARLAVDSTVATPVLSRPIELGADFVVHSASKYLNGHSDVLAGAVVCAKSDSFWQRVRAWRRDGGAVLGPFEAWLLLRGMRTLFVRVERSSQSALAVARHFVGHERLTHVLYPGLPNDPGHAVAARQMSGGFSGMLSFRVKGGEAAAVAAAAAVTVFKRATSLGGVESLIEQRASIEGPGSAVPPDLLRLSIGLENPADLIADLEQALARTDPTASVSVPKASTEAGPAAPGTMGPLAARVAALLDERIRPLVADRGGDLRLVGVEAGVVTLAMAGSPGAALTIRGDILNLLRHHLPDVVDLRFHSSAASDGPATTAVPSDEAVRQVLESVINPAVAAHDGRVQLVRVEGGTAAIRFEGRCQGCALAEVTLRQGIEVAIKEQVPAITAVIDETDHEGGRDPYFITKKGAD